MAQRQIFKSHTPPVFGKLGDVKLGVLHEGSQVIQVFLKPRQSTEADKRVCKLTVELIQVHIHVTGHKICPLVVSAKPLYCILPGYIHSPIPRHFFPFLFPFPFPPGECCCDVPKGFACIPSQFRGKRRVSCRGKPPPAGCTCTFLTLVLVLAFLLGPRTPRTPRT